MIFVVKHVLGPRALGPHAYQTLKLQFLVIHHHRTVDVQPTQLMVEEASPGLNVKLGLAVYFSLLQSNFKL